MARDEDGDEDECADDDDDDDERGTTDCGPIFRRSADRLSDLLRTAEDRLSPNFGGPRVGSDGGGSVVLSPADSREAALVVVVVVVAATVAAAADVDDDFGAIDDIMIPPALPEAFSMEFRSLSDFLSDRSCRAAKDGTTYVGIVHPGLGGGAGCGADGAGGGATATAAATDGAAALCCCGTLRSVQALLVAPDVVFVNISSPLNCLAVAIASFGRTAGGLLLDGMSE